MFIANMGLFWRRDCVFWGTRGYGKKGKLLGVPADARSATPTDFWMQSGIYALYAEYKLVYVGQAGSGAQSRLGFRLRQHIRDDLAERWDAFSWFGFSYVKKDNTLSTPPGTRNVSLVEMLNILEGTAIAIAEPPLNSQDGRFGDTVERYLQVRDDSLGLSEREKLTQIHETIAKIAKKLQV